MQGTFDGQRYRIVHASGHLYGFPKDISTLVPQEKAEQYKSWTMEYLPWDPADIRWIIKPDPGKKKTIDNIRQALSSADEVCIATDNDPSGEGDLLAWEILIALKWKGKTSRMMFSDESVPEIRKGFSARKPVAGAQASGEFLKANARSKFDYLSMQLTRIASLQAKERGHRMLVRQGRLKSVMVYLIGWQLEQIKNYKKVPFYEARYRDENGHVYKVKEEDAKRFASAAEVDLSLYEDAEVVLDSRQKKTSAPGPLLTLAGLTSILVEKKGFDSKKILEVYQKMYQDQVVSYPRTEDRCVTKEQYDQLKNARFRIAQAVGIDESLLTCDTLRKKHYQKSAAHGANRPGPAVPASLDELREKYGEEGAAIYELLAKNSLAMFGEDYVYEHQVGHIKTHPEFVGTANLPISMGFKVIFDTEPEKGDDEDDEESGAKPLGTKASSFVHEGANPKPKTPTMKWLIGSGGQLDKYNVGTGATRTSTFNDVVDGSDKEKQLVIMGKKGNLSLTNVGEVSYTLLSGCYFASPKITEKLLEQMELVGKFQKPPDDIIGSITPLVVHDMEAMKRNAEKIPMGNDSFRQTVKTGKVIYEPTGEEIVFSREWGGHTFTDDEVSRLAAGEVIEFEAVSKKTGNAFTARGALEKQKYKGRTFWGFAMEVEDSPPESWCGHVFDEEEMRDLMDGKTISAEDFVSAKTGNTFEAELKWNAKKGKLVPSFPKKNAKKK